MTDVDQDVEVVVAHHERATLRVGRVFLKIDADQSRTDAELEAMAMAPVPTPRILWRQPPALALAALPGSALGRIGAPSSASPEAWAAAGAIARKLHDAPLPPRRGQNPAEIAEHLTDVCDWLVAHGVLTKDVVIPNLRAARAALRGWKPAFIHGDLQPNHVFIENDEVTGVLDWSEAAQGDALYDLASLTLGHQEHLSEVETGYGAPIDRGAIRGWWSLRSLRVVRWLTEHGFDPAPEIAVLKAQP